MLQFIIKPISLPYCENIYYFQMKQEKSLNKVNHGIMHTKKQLKHILNMVNFVCSNIIAKGHSRFTVLSMRLSSGLRFGSQLEERIPVPQLSASVFLQSKYHSQPLEGTHTKFFQNTMRSLHLSNTIY